MTDIQKIFAEVMKKEREQRQATVVALGNCCVAISWKAKDKQ